MAEKDIIIVYKEIVEEAWLKWNEYIDKEDEKRKSDKKNKKKSVNGLAGIVLNLYPNGFKDFFINYLDKLLTEK